MSKIIIRGEFPIQPGKAEAGKEAARVLRERVLREDEGVTLYEFFVDESGKTMAITEVYRDEPSLMNHIAASDFTRLSETLDFARAKIQIHGSPSDTLRKTFQEIVGPVEVFLPI
jgi:quinol monooxygenase YgiN